MLYNTAPSASNRPLIQTFSGEGHRGGVRSKGGCRQPAVSRRACKKVESLKQHVDLKQPVLLSRLVLAWEIYNATRNFLFLRYGYRIVSESEKQLMQHRSTN
jgi:hypothetical protein